MLQSVHLAEHASKCRVGPSFAWRHAMLRNTLGDWLAEVYGQCAVTFEQRILGWDKPTLAILDVHGAVCVAAMLRSATSMPTTLRIAGSACAN